MSFDCSFSRWVYSRMSWFFRLASASAPSAVLELRMRSPSSASYWDAIMSTRCWMPSSCASRCCDAAMVVGSSLIGVLASVAAVTLSATVLVLVSSTAVLSSESSSVVVLEAVGAPASTCLSWSTVALILSARSQTASVRSLRLARAPSLPETRLPTSTPSMSLDCNFSRLVYSRMSWFFRLASASAPSKVSALRLRRVGSSASYSDAITSTRRWICSSCARVLLSSSPVVVPVVVLRVAMMKYATSIARSKSAKTPHGRLRWLLWAT